MNLAIQPATDLLEPLLFFYKDYFDNKMKKTVYMPLKDTKLNQRKTLSVTYNGKFSV